MSPTYSTWSRAILVGLLPILLSGSSGVSRSAEPANPPTAGVPAFPGAEGFGATTVGGRGGRILEVTNLHDAGPGSFRAAATCRCTTT